MEKLYRQVIEPNGVHFFISEEDYQTAKRNNEIPSDYKFSPWLRRKCSPIVTYKEP